MLFLIFLDRTDFRLIRGYIHFRDTIDFTMDFETCSRRVSLESRRQPKYRIQFFHKTEWPPMEMQSPILGFWRLLLLVKKIASVLLLFKSIFYLEKYVDNWRLPISNLFFTVLYSLDDVIRAVSSANKANWQSVIVGMSLM